MRCFSIAFAILIVSMISGCSEETDSGTPGLLVSTEWLQNHLNDPELVLLHSGTAEIFDSLHIPGARLIIPAAFTENIDGVRNEMLPADSIVKLLKNFTQRKRVRI